MSQRQNSAVPSQNNNDISNIINDICGGLNVTSIPATDDNRRFINPASPAHQPSTTPLDSSPEETAGDSNLDAKTANPTSALQAESIVAEPKTEQTAKVLNGLEIARQRLEEEIQALPDEFKAFLSSYWVDDWGWIYVKCKCNASFGSIVDFNNHVRLGACKARRCACGDTWLSLGELLEHVRKTGCTIDPNPPPDPPEKGTKRRWRRLHRNGGFLEVGDCE
jgi:hypothetical protein